MGSCRRAACAALVALTALFAASAEPFIVGALHSEPTMAMQIAAAADAALQHEAEEADPGVAVAPGAGEVAVEGAEPGEPIDLLRALCQLATAGATLWLCGACGSEAPSLRAAAERTGLLQLSVERASVGADADALALYPPDELLARVAAALMSEKGWTRAVLLHEGAPPASALVALGAAEPALGVTARRLPAAGERALLRNLLLVLKRGGARHFAVWCSRECLLRVLGAAQRVGMLSDAHSYLLLDLDLHTLRLANYSHGGANVTGLRLFDPESSAVRRAMGAWREAYLRRAPAAEPDAAALLAAPPVALLLAYDAVRLAATAWRELALPAAAATRVCSSGRGAPHAHTLLNYMRTMETSGATGPLRFDSAGRRSEAALEVVELVRGGRLLPVARWVRAAGGAGATGEQALSWTRAPTAAPEAAGDSVTNKSFTILIALNDPYVMYRESAERLSGNERFEGFCVELIERLAAALHFNYTFLLQEDMVYGSYNNNTGRWNGMMARLMFDDDVQFAITDLTITAERESAVDFTTPFMNLGISILFTQPTEPSPAFFAFLLPFSPGVWASLGLAYVGTSLLLYTVGRLCPEEWQNPYPCVEEPAALENQFTLANAFWFNLGAVLLQGSEIAPVAYGTRAVASMWWLFALVITSSYTANLATLLARKTTAELIHGVEDLATNDLGIHYGAKYQGSTYDFFQKSQEPTYKEMFKRMQQEPMPMNNTAGVTKVMQGGYAFLMESTSIEYLTQRNCDIKQVGGLLDSKGYGIAMKKNSTYRQALNLALLNLQESGALREMKQKWWNEKHGGGSCTADDSVESEKLSLKNFKGLFLVLMVGSALGVAVSLCDLLLHARRARQGSGDGVAATFGAQLWTELRFVFKFGRSEKPLVLLPSPPPSSSPPRESAADETSGRSEPSEREPRSPPGSERRSRRGSRRRSTQHTIHEASVRLARHALRAS